MQGAPKNVMEREPQNGRTHEPDLREVVADLDGLRELLDEKSANLLRVMDERDTRYEQRFTAMDEKTSLALTASEKAVTKAETATEKRFDAVNEFRGSLKDQADTLYPRTEAETKFRSYDEKMDDMKKEISALREYKSESTGKAVVSEKNYDVERLQKSTNIATTIAAVAAVASVCGVIIALIVLLLRAHG
jgi:hypothetical protein